MVRWQALALGAFSKTSDNTLPIVTGFAVSEKPKFSKLGGGYQAISRHPFFARQVYWISLMHAKSGFCDLIPVHKIPHQLDGLVWNMAMCWIDGLGIFCFHVHRVYGAIAMPHQNRILFTGIVQSGESFHPYERDFTINRMICVSSWYCEPFFSLHIKRFRGFVGSRSANRNNSRNRRGFFISQNDLYFLCGFSSLAKLNNTSRSPSPFIITPGRSGMAPF